jgi:hypothetical protein
VFELITARAQRQSSSAAHYIALVNSSLLSKELAEHCPQKGYQCILELVLCLLELIDDCPQLVRLVSLLPLDIRSVCVVIPTHLFCHVLGDLDFVSEPLGPSGIVNVARLKLLSDVLQIVFELLLNLLNTVIGPIKLLILARCRLWYLFRANTLPLDHLFEFFDDGSEVREYRLALFLLLLFIGHLPLPIIPLVSLSELGERLQALGAERFESVLVEDICEDFDQPLQPTEESVEFIQSGDH